MKLIRIAAIFGALAVILGAFGAHSLKKLLEPDQLQAFETGVRYQFYHTLALLICGLLTLFQNRKLWRLAGGFFIAGMVCFSGSIYLLSVRTLLGMENLNWLGPVTPIGGLLLITAWILLFTGSLKDS